MNLQLLTAPVREPILLQDAKDHIDVETNEHDPQIMRYIAAARAYVEEHIRKKIIRQQWRIYLDHGLREIDLVPNEVQEVAQVQYIDADGATQTLSASVYEVDIPRQKLLLGYGQTWPTTRGKANDAWVDVWCGYYDAATSPINLVSRIPADIYQAMMLIVDDSFEHRGSKITGTVVTDNRMLNAMLAPHRLYHR